MAGERDSVVDFTHWRQDARRKVLEQMFREHGDALRQFLRVRFNAETDLEDIVQDVFVWLAKKDDLLNSVSPQSGSNRSFLLTAANSMAVDLERRKAVRRQYGASQQDEARQRVMEITPEKLAEDRQQLEHVHNAILNMRPTWRKVFVMNRFEHKSYRQIANEMRVSVKQIEKYMSRALGEIRKAVRRSGSLASQGEEA